MKMMILIIPNKIFVYFSRNPSLDGPASNTPFLIELVSSLTLYLWLTSLHCHILVIIIDHLYMYSVPNSAIYTNQFPYF